MAGRRCVTLLLLLGVSLVHFTAAEELKMDEALLTVRNHLPDAITLLYISDYCYQCLFQPLLTVPSATSSLPTNNTVIVSTHFALAIQVMRGGGSKDPVCSFITQLTATHKSLHERRSVQEEGPHTIGMKSMKDPGGLWTTLRALVKEGEQKTPDCIL